MMLEKNNSHLFLQAQKEFSLGNFSRAQKITKNIDTSVKLSAEVTGSTVSKTAIYSIIVLTHRHSEDVEKLILSLKKYSEDELYEVLLVNNGNTQLARIASDFLINYRIIDVGFNYGCSGGRNVGAHHAVGEYVIFIDDDGILLEGSIENLVQVATSNSAAAVRGKVLPRTKSLPVLPHYDLGDVVIPALPTTEGISIWHREFFLKFGGFDVLLSGHEGLLLCCKMFRFFGPRYFLYTPEAVLFHDYANDVKAIEQKEKKHKANKSYLDFYFSDWGDVYTLMSGFRSDLKSEEDFLLVVGNQLQLLGDAFSHEKVSIITTAKDASDFVEDYSISLQLQSIQNFEIIFVDDGSNDDTVLKIKELWKGDCRLNVIETRGVGRAQALNIAVHSAENRICLIADVDDISVPHRIEWTLRYFTNYSNSSCASFFVFNEQSAHRAAKPFIPSLINLRARSMVGMPVTFPSFAFLRDNFIETFDETLTAGIDCDWVFRNLFRGHRHGHFIPIASVYYRLHDKQITAQKRGLQKDVAVKSVIEAHRSVIGGVSEEHKECIAMMSGWEKVRSKRDLDRVTKYLVFFFSKLRINNAEETNDIQSYLFATLQELKLKYIQSSGQQNGHENDTKLNSHYNLFSLFTNKYYRKYQTSCVLLNLSFFLPSRFEARHQKRKRKNARLLNSQVS